MENKTKKILTPNPGNGEFGEKFSYYIASLEPGCDKSVKTALKLVAEAAERGQVCIHLDDFAGQHTDTEDNLPGEPIPELKVWIKRLIDSSLVGQPGDFTPLILDQNQRLYLARYWNYEKILAAQLTLRANMKISGIDISKLRQALDRLFPTSNSHSDMQKAAVAAAVLNRVTVISGGPGTGKTTTIFRLLAAIDILGIADPARIALAAPTGKAAARMIDALSTALDQKCTVNVSAFFPTQAFTLHRLLDSRRESVMFGYNADNQLPFDVVVVDEASMVDLALMTKLIVATSENTRLILLGDKNQLSSVEAGAVFADICAQRAYDKKFRDQLFNASGVDLPTAQNQNTGLGNSTILLEHNFRFSPKSGLGRLAGLIKNNQADRALALLQDDRYPDICWVDTQDLSNETRLIEQVLQGFASYAQSLGSQAKPDNALRLFNRFRLLSPYKNGQTGTIRLNRLIESHFDNTGPQDPQSKWYHGRPVMITRNDYNLNLFNGDIGVALKTGGEIRVFFESTDKSIRSFNPSRVPEHETAYAMTVHKSQGSEFDEVIIILPSLQSEILTRTLLYTAVTRARRRVEIWTNAEIFSASVATMRKSKSGFRDRLCNQIV